MPNQKKYKNRYVTTLPFEKEQFDRFNELLPRGVTIADEINKFIEERVRDLESEKNRDASIAVEASPIRSDSYNSNELTRDTTLDEYIRVYEDDTMRFKNMYTMTQEELYEYGRFVDNHLTEISIVMYDRYKVPHFLGRKIDHLKRLQIRSLVYGGGSKNEESNN